MWTRTRIIHIGQVIMAPCCDRPAKVLTWVLDGWPHTWPPRRTCVVEHLGGPSDGRQCQFDLDAQHEVAVAIGGTQTAAAWWRERQERQREAAGP